MKRFLITLALILSVLFGTGGIAHAASQADLTHALSFGTRYVDADHTFRARATNIGSTAGPLYMDFDIPIEFWGDYYLVTYNTTGTTIYCSGPPVMYCYTTGNAPVGTYFQVLYTGAWNEAGTFTSQINVSNSFSGPPQDYKIFQDQIWP